MSESERTTADDEHFVISRVFNAPRDVVWEAWTAPDRLVAWFGPKGAPRARIIRHEFRVGGVFLSAQTLPDGAELCGKFIYREITPGSRLVWVHSFADARGENTRHPFLPTWPLELLTTVTFEDLGARTKVTVDWVPLNASAAELETFHGGLANTHEGWSGSFDVLDDLLQHG